MFLIQTGHQILVFVHNTEVTLSSQQLLKREAFGGTFTMKMHCATFFLALLGTIQALNLADVPCGNLGSDSR